MIYNILEFMNI